MFIGMDNTFNKTHVSAPADDTRGKEPENHETYSLASSPHFDASTIIDLESDQDLGSHHKEPLDDQDNSELYGSSSSSYNSALSEIESFTISTFLNQGMMQDLEYSDDEDKGLHHKLTLDGHDTSDVNESSSSSYTSALSDLDSDVLSPCINQDFELENDVFSDIDIQCMLTQDNQGTSDFYWNSPYNSVSSETDSITLSPCLKLDKIQDFESDKGGFEDVGLNCMFPLDAKEKEEWAPVCDGINQTTLGDRDISNHNMNAASYFCNSTTACGRPEKQADKHTSSILGAQEGEEIQCSGSIPLSSLEYDSLNMDNGVSLCNSVDACGGPDEQRDNLDPSTARVQAVANQLLPPEIDQTVIRDPKQIQLLLDHAKRALSASQIHLASKLTTRAYQSLGEMANQMEDSIVALGYETCSDVFLKIGGITMAVKSIFQGIKYSSSWKKSKFDHLWMVFFGAYDFVELIRHEVKSLLEELEQISVDLERDKKWDKCCFVSHNLYNSYVKAEPHNLWNHHSIMANKKRMVLRMARCTYQTTISVLEQLCEYDCVEALMLWAISLRETKKYDVALKKAERALECCKSEAERQIIKNLIGDVHQSRDEELPEDNLWEWLEGTNVGKDAKERQRAEEARRRYVKKTKRHGSKRRENSSDQEDTAPQPSEVLTRETTKSSHSIVPETELLYKRTLSLSDIPLSETILQRSSTSSENGTNASDFSASLSARSSPVKMRKKMRKRINRNFSGTDTKIVGNIVTWTGSILSRQRSLYLNIENLDDVHCSESDEGVPVVFIPVLMKKEQIHILETR